MARTSLFRLIARSHGPESLAPGENATSSFACHPRVLSNLSNYSGLWQPRNNNHLDLYPSSIVTSQVVIIRGVVLVIESHNVLHNHLRQMEKACEPRRVGAAVSGATPGGGCLSVGLDRVIHSLAVAG